MKIQIFKVDFLVKYKSKTWQVHPRMKNTLYFVSRCRANGRIMYEGGLQWVPEMLSFWMFLNKRKRERFNWTGPQRKSGRKRSKRTELKNILTTFYHLVTVYRSIGKIPQKSAPLLILFDRVEKDVRLKKVKTTRYESRSGWGTSISRALSTVSDAGKKIFVKWKPLSGCFVAKASSRRCKRRFLF